jgi:tetratricopeptide (TPR) repeat protein
MGTGSCPLPILQIAMAKPELTEWDTDLTAPLDEEYEALVRAIRYAQGFSLLFVQCSPGQGEELIARVRDDVVDKTVDVLRLEREVDDLYDTVAALPNIDKTNVLFISGLEKSLVPYIKPGYGSEGDYYAKDSVPKILGKLNLQRESFRETFKLCFVFLVPLYAMKYLIRRAADFFDWRSGVWEFVGSADEVQLKTDQVLQDNYEEYLNWTPQQRRERFWVIEDLLIGGRRTKEEQSRLRRVQGRLLSADQDYGSAIDYYDAAIAIKPNYFRALKNKGTALFRLERYEAAISSFDAALAIESNDHSTLFDKGLSLLYLGRYEEAITFFDAALTIKPNYPSALANKGNALSCLGSYEEAVAHFDAAVAIKSDYYKPFNNKGLALYELGCHAEAVASYDAALAIKPDYYNALCGKGRVLDKMGRYEEAITCYDAALKIKPDDDGALYNKGIALDKLGRYEEAIACYDAALAIKPDYQLAINNKQKVLEKLRQHSSQA